jgi:L-seryl-tRNA(Ser) seleniumtransferase
LRELKQRAEALAAQVRDLPGVAGASTREDVAYVGGGSLPDQTMKTWIVALEPRDLPDATLAYRLRTGTPAVVARLRDGKLILDVRTVFPQQEAALIEALRAALA